MTIPNESLATRGYGNGATLSTVARRGYSQGSTASLNATLATRGYGTNSSPASVITRGYSTLSGLPIIPPAGFNYVTVGSLPWLPTAESVLENAVPTVPAGDVIRWTTQTLPSGFTVTMNPDGTFVVAANSNTSRQKFSYNIFDVTAQQLYQATDAVVYVNNQPPSQTSVPSLASYTIGQTISTLNLSNYVTDPQGDTLTFTISPASSSTLPPGLSLSSPNVSGTPNQIGTFSVTFRATNAAGTYVDMVPIAFTVNPGSGFVSLEQARATLAAAGVSIGTITYAYDSVVPLGYVVSQSAVGTAVAGTTVNLVVSNGPAPSATQSTVPNVQGKYYYDAQLALLSAGVGVAPPEYAVSSTVLPGFVISQSIAPGTLVAPQTQVSIVVSQIVQPAYIAPTNPVIPPV